MNRPEIAPDLTFPDLDSAESALDWIGVAFVEGQDVAGGWFAGELDEEAIELIDAALDDVDVPPGVRVLATVLRGRWNDDTLPKGWCVTFPA